MLSRGNSHNALLLGVGTMGTNWFLLDSGTAGGRHLKPLKEVDRFAILSLRNLKKRKKFVVALFFCL